jgi:hypothetical protein
MCPPVESTKRSKRHLGTIGEHAYNVEKGKIAPTNRRDTRHEEIMRNLAVR